MSKKSKAYVAYLRSKVGLNNGDANELNGVDTDVAWPSRTDRAPHNDIYTDYEKNIDSGLDANEDGEVSDEEEEEFDADEEDENMEEAKSWKWVIRRSENGSPRKVKKWITDKEGYKISNDGNGHVKEVRYTPTEERERKIRRRKAKSEFLANKNTNNRKTEQSKEMRDRMGLDNDE